MVQTTIIAACDKNRGIGLKGTIPWHISADFRHFRETTRDSIVIMGRKTFDSLPGNDGLPSRLNIVITTNPLTNGKPIICIRDPWTAWKEAKAIAEAFNKEIFIIGGSQIYNALQSAADRLVITEIDKEYEVDTYLPHFHGDWTPICEKSLTSHEGSDVKVKYFERNMKPLTMGEVR